ncbi:MAG: serine/threonine protein kinase [Methanobacteriota archaeon]|nr:MAG: serine/threonine protein kinase [Euryarchaeota archaeon]
MAKLQEGIKEKDLSQGSLFVFVVLEAAQHLKDLKKMDYKILRAIEIGMRYGQYVSVETIMGYTKLSQQKTEYILSNLHKKGMVRRWTGHFIGYELTSTGYDSLALDRLYEEGHIVSLGDEKGMGKESQVFFAQRPDGTTCIIKIHRVGYTSFQQTRKKRRYTSDKRHLSALYASRLSAEEEFKWLKRAYKNGLPVPEPLAINRHIIVMEFIDGWDLVEIRKLEDAEEFLDDILQFIKDAWCKAGIVHGDLSQYNIIITPDGEIRVIDMPQAVEKWEENAMELLERDIRNVLVFFERKYKIRRNEKEVLSQTIDCED